MTFSNVLLTIALVAITVIFFLYKDDDDDFPDQSM